jgi:ABC-type thiamin/hydroxymethylpyrimidine transport system permease subunit
MTQSRPHFFSLHELFVMAALAALGGVSGSAVSMIRAAVHAVVVLPGGMQFLGGIHVLWLVLAVGLIRKPGAATITGLLMGAVELLSSNPHGLIVLMYALLAGVGVDLVWLLLGRRDSLLTYMLAGGVGAASNILVLALVASLPAHDGVITGLGVLAGIAFVSGLFLAGMLGWWLLTTLRLAGVVGARPQPTPIHGSRPAWAAVGALGTVLAIVVAVIYLNADRVDGSATDESETTPVAQTCTITPP